MIPFLPRRELWASLPQAFVGMPCQLLPAVQLLCGEMELSFLEAGRPVPPWRACSATLPRWMSDAFTEAEVPLQPAGQPLTREAAAFLERMQALTSPGPPAAAAVAAPGTAAAGSSSGGGAADRAGSRGGRGEAGAMPGAAQHAVAGTAETSSAAHPASLLSSGAGYAGNTQHNVPQQPVASQLAQARVGAAVSLSAPAAAHGTPPAGGFAAPAASPAAEPTAFTRQETPSAALPKRRSLSLLTSKLAEAQGPEAAFTFFKHWPVKSGAH